MGNRFGMRKGNVADDEPELIMSQVAALSRQIPLLYGILTVSTIVLAFTYYGMAPAGLTVVVPGILSIVTISRSIRWLYRIGSVPTLEQAKNSLQFTRWATLLLTWSFTGWALSLFPYGDAYAQCYIAFYMGITVISVMYCLMHLRIAALIAAGAMGIPFLVFFLSTGQPVLVAMAVNYMLVMAGLTIILLRNYDDFRTLIRSKIELGLRHAEAEKLAADNLNLANLDSLTGLPNRRRFMAVLEDSFDMARQTNTRVAVALIDLDGFKAVNDAYGHSVGDELLLAAASRLANLAIPGMIVARLGGDEFGAILPGDPDDLDVATFGKAIGDALQNVQPRPDLATHVTASVGVVTYPDAAATTELVLERADYALYYAKDHRRGQAVIFSHEHEAMICSASGVAAALREADFDREMRLVFQPIVDVTSGRVEAMEALARWTSPTMGAVGPDVFIQAAERSGQIQRLTAVLFGKALAAATTWPPGIRVSFNLSAKDLAAPSLMIRLREMVIECGIEPSRIQLELTETAVIHDMQQALEALAPLRQMGILVALDDFGTGYSSFSHVHRLQPDIIKVDRSFVACLHDSRLAPDILRTILDLSRNIGAQCIVEGVETVSQRQHVADIGCRYMQGYYFSRPVEDVEPMLRRLESGAGMLEPSGGEPLAS